jgi:hypothetical protein
MGNHSSSTDARSDTASAALPSGASYAEAPSTQNRRLPLKCIYRLRRAAESGVFARVM